MDTPNNRDGMMVGRINLRPSEPYLAARDLDALIELWLEDCDERLTPYAAQFYRYRVHRFRTWWGEVGPGQGWQLRKRDLVRYERHLRQIKNKWGKPYTYNSRASFMKHLSMMFRWAHKEGYIGIEYSAWVPPAEGEPPRRKPVSLEQLRALFAAARHSRFPNRDQAILAFLIGTGVRRSECASLTVEALQFHADGSGVALVKGKRTRANRSGTREVAFDATTGTVLQRYLDSDGITSGPMWPGQRGPLKPNSLYWVVKRCIESAGLEGTLQGPHDLRRAFATTMARYAQDAHIDGQTIQRQMGHSSFAMTTRYILPDFVEIAQSLHSPMSMIQSCGDDIGDDIEDKSNC